MGDTTATHQRKERSRSPPTTGLDAGQRSELEKDCTCGGTNPRTKERSAEGFVAPSRPLSRAPLRPTGPARGAAGRGGRSVAVLGSDRPPSLTLQITTATARERPSVEARPVPTHRPVVGRHPLTRLVLWSCTGARGPGRTADRPGSLVPTDAAGAVLGSDPRGGRDQVMRRRAGSEAEILKRPMPGSRPEDPRARATSLR